MAGVVENTRKAYNKSTRNLNFHSAWVKVRTAKDAVDAIGTYNQFRPSSVKGALDQVQGNDPNARFSIGREGSPVIYIETGKPRSVIGVLSSMDPYRKPDELEKVTGGQRTRQRLARLPKKSDGKSVVRAWWD